jgi:Zn-dependent protease with chaperone function
MLLAVTAPIWMLELGQIVSSSMGLITMADPYATARTIEEQGLVVANIRNILLPIILIVLMFFLATVIYLSHPIRIRHKKNLRKITRKDDPDFVDAIQELVDISRISPLPLLEVASGSRSMAGQAFGLWRNYSLQLGGRFRLLFRKDVESFRAIILHELAHIGNADITRTYFTQAIWIATIGMTVIPFLGLSIVYFIRMLVNPSGADISIVLLSLLKIGGAMLIITAIYSGLLRSREFYADYRAALWGAGKSLANILKRTILSKAKNQQRMGLWKLHPSAEERLVVFQDPDKLFRVKTALPFLVGVLPGLMLGGVYSQWQFLILLLGALANGLLQIFGNSLFDNKWSSVLLAFMAFALISIPGFVITSLMANSLGLAVQRETLANMDKGREGWLTYLAILKPAILVTIGTQIGGSLAVSSILEILPEVMQSRDGPTYILVTVFQTITFAFFTWLGLIYLRIFTRQLLGTHFGQSSPTGKMRLLTLIFSLLLLMFYVPILFGQTSIEAAASAADFSMLLPWVPGVVFGEAIAILSYILVFIVTWLVVWWTRVVRTPHCPTCGQIADQRYAVGQSCKTCGNELAPWLYTTQPSET